MTPASQCVIRPVGKKGVAAKRLRTGGLSNQVLPMARATGGQCSSSRASSKPALLRHAQGQSSCKAGLSPSMSGFPYLERWELSQTAQVEGSE